MSLQIAERAHRRFPVGLFLTSPLPRGRQFLARCNQGGWRSQRLSTKAPLLLDTDDSSCLRGFLGLQDPACDRTPGSGQPLTATPSVPHHRAILCSTNTTLPLGQRCQDLQLSASISCPLILVFSCSEGKCPPAARATASEWEAMYYDDLYSVRSEPTEIWKQQVLGRLWREGSP